MTRNEFEQRIGRKVDDEEFRTANAIYMACGDGMDKDTFCKLYTTKDGKQELLVAMADEVTRMRNGLDGKTKELADAGSFMAEFVGKLIGKAHICKDRDFQKLAARVVGQKEVVVNKVRLGIQLTSADREIIIKALESQQD